MSSDTVSSPEELRLKRRIAELELALLKSNQPAIFKDDQFVRPPVSDDAVLCASQIVVEIDPYVAAEMKTLRLRLREAESALTILKENATVTNFSADGPLGKRLLDKCRKLLAENRQLGEALLSSRVAILEQTGQLAAQRDQMLIAQLKPFFAYTADLEAQCGELSRRCHRLDAQVQALTAQGPSNTTDSSRPTRAKPPPNNSSRSGRQRDRSSSFDSREPDWVSSRNDKRRRRMID